MEARKKTDPAYLSPAELRAVYYLGQGLTAKQIARKVHRSPKTIEHQLESARRRIKVRTSVALAVWASRQGLLDRVPA